MKDWVYNEYNHVGVDYSISKNTSVYDKQMETFRDYENETRMLIDKLKITNTEQLNVADLGCGTGAFSIHVARYFNKVYAVDVSEEMLKISSAKAEALCISNIEFIKAGFLSYIPIEKCDIVFSKWAFHHLPDYWKQAGLININRMLKQDGLFYLIDVVFKFDPNYDSSIDILLNDLSKTFSTDFIEETKTHIRDEFSTFDWILHGLIERAGFIIEYSNTDDVLQSEYCCRKKQSI
jgi:putative AdoMet-dependent methyltransferase